MAEQHGDDMSGWQHSVVPSGMTLEYHPRWGSKKVYVCHRGLLQHRGRPEACGRRCQAARGDDDARFEEEPSVQMLGRGGG